MESSAQAASLREAIAAVGAPSADEANDYRIATSVGPAFLARARSGAPTLLIPLDVAPVTVGRRGGGFSLTPATRVAFEYAGRRWEQAAATLECTESQLVDAFLVLVVDIARRLASAAGEITWPTILAWVEEWQMLLARRAVLTAEQQLGLWGELWVISKAVNPDPLVAAWRGPEGEAVDFFLRRRRPRGQGVAACSRAPRLSTPDRPARRNAQGLPTVGMGWGRAGSWNIAGRVGGRSLGAGVRRARRY